MPRAQATDLGRSQFAPGAKRSMSRTYIPRALAAGARLLAGCRAVRLRHRGRHVTEVEAVETTPEGRRRLAIRAGTVFACGGAIQTPVLLRASGITRNVGDSLRLHPMVKVAAEFSEELDSHAAPVPIYQVHDLGPDLTLGGSVFTPGFLAMTLGENWAENEEAMRQWRRMALFHVACRGSNRGSVRVWPWTGEAVVRYDLSRADRVNLGIGLGRLCQALFAGGATRIYPELLFEWVARGRDVYVLGGGENRYQFVHAEDLAGACIRAAARPGFAVYNVGTDRFGTMRESLQALIAHAGTGSRVRSLPMRPAVLGMKLLSGAGLAPFAPYHWAMYGRELYVDIERARSELGWTPRWSNVDMLCQAYDWYVRHGRAGRGAGASPHRSPVREGLLRVLRWLS